jgi:hypothetical protein
MRVTPLGSLLAPLQRALSRLLQAAVAALFAYGVATANVPVAVNAGLALAVTFLPGVLRRDYGLPLDPGLTLLLTAAVFLHALGMTGPYETVPWWDHMTHTLSAVVVASAGYVVTRAVDEHAPGFDVPEEAYPAYLVGFTLAAGLVWELAELAIHAGSDRLGVDAVLVPYGLEDALWDLAFDALGALVVAAFGRRRLRPLVDALRERLDARGGVGGENGAGGGADE